MEYKEVLRVEIQEVIRRYRQDQLSLITWTLSNAKTAYFDAGRRGRQAT